MPLILHIGLPKTGTTFLQKSFYNAFSNLDNPPIIYPDLKFYNHQIALYEPLGQYLPWDAKPGNPENWKKLLSLLKQPTDLPVLLSSEALSCLSDEGLHKFLQIISGWRLFKVVITARALANLLPSHWQQNMKQGGRGSLEKYAIRILKSIEADQSPAQMFCYANTIRKWRSVFKNIPIIVLFMNGSFKQNLYAFAEQCGVGTQFYELLDKSIPPASEQNLSFSADECRKLLIINRKISKGLLEPNARKKAINHFFKIRDKGYEYEKPRLSSELKERADLIDFKALDEINNDINTKFIHVNPNLEQQ